MTGFRFVGEGRVVILLPGPPSLDDSRPPPQFYNEVCPPLCLPWICGFREDLLGFMPVIRNILWVFGNAADDVIVPLGQLWPSIQRCQFLIDPGLIIELRVPTKSLQSQVVELILRTGSTDLPHNLQAFRLVIDRSVTRLLNQIAHERVRSAQGLVRFFRLSPPLTLYVPMTPLMQ